MSPVRTLALAQLRADLRHAGTGKRRGGRVAMTAVAYGFSGLVLALSLGPASPEEVLFVAGSFGFVLAAFGVVGSYDDLMGRPKDNAWLTTLPASEAQHYAARVFGIAGYVLLMAVSVSVPIGARVALSADPGAGALVGALVGAGVVWTAAASLAVLWAVTLALPERMLRPAVGAARTLLVASLVIGYQWIGSGLGAAAAPWWPGAWLADGLTGRPTLGLGVLAASVVGLAVAFAFVFPRRYFRLLARLSAGERRTETEHRTRSLTAVERALTRTGPERAAYGFAVAAFTDDRVVRGRLWPAALLPLGFALFGWIAGGLGSLFVYGPENALTYTETQLHLSVLVVLLFCAQSLVQTLQFSDHAQAAWVFGTLPEAGPRGLQMGAQQALAVRVLAPLHVGLAVVLAFQMPALDAAVHALFWFAVTVVVTRLYALAYRTPPFSRPSDRFSTGARFVPLLVSVPAALLVLLLQTATFTSRPTAVLASLGLLVASDAAGRLAVTLGRPRSSAPPVPADVAALAAS
jgi:hypothetical protein